MPEFFTRTTPDREMVKDEYLICHLEDIKIKLFKEGNRHTYVLNENPTGVFEGDEVQVIKTSKYSETSWPFWVSPPYQKVWDFRMMNNDRLHIFPSHEQDWSARGVSPHGLFFRAVDLDNQELFSLDGYRYYDRQLDDVLKQCFSVGHLKCPDIIEVLSKKREVS